MEPVGFFAYRISGAMLLVPHPSHPGNRVRPPYRAVDYAAASNAGLICWFIRKKLAGSYVFLPLDEPIVMLA